MVVVNDVVLSTLSSTQIQTVVQAWQGIALDELRPVIDRQALAMKSADERSQKARKQLAQLLKVVKQVQQSETDQDVINKSIADVIKSFQKEVDELTKRSIFAENCFQQVYSKLYVAPDPTAALSIAILYNQEKEKTSSLQQKLHDYETELDQVKNQEVTIRELEHRIKELSEGEASRSSNDLKEQAKQFEIERMRLLKESQHKEELLQQELHKCRDLLSKTQAQLDDLQTKLVVIHDRKEKGDSARENFSHGISEELISAKSELASLKHENAILKTSLSRAAHLSTDEGVSEAKRQLVESQHLLEKLLRDYNASLQENESLRQQVNDHISSRTSTEKRYQADIAALQQKISSLQDTVKSLPSLDAVGSLKKQLKLLQMLNFTAVEEGELSTDLERALLTKAQKLESELTKMRLEQITLQKQVEEATSALQASQEQSAQSSSIIEKLESTIADLSRTPIVGSSLTAPTSANTSEILSIQRDRYRKAVESFEVERSTLQHRNESLSQQVSTLQKDNENLYLRLQAIQLYNNKSQADLESGRAVENKYAKIITEKQNPFKKFARDQRQRSYAELNIMEKMILTSTKMCLGNKSLRTATFLYIVTLHALVFVSLLTHTVMSHCPQHPKH